MPSLTIKNIPQEVHRRLRRVAGMKRRSMNGEAIVCLEKGLRFEEPANPPAYLAKIRKLRAKIPLFLTDRDIDRAVNEGRE